MRYKKNLQMWELTIESLVYLIFVVSYLVELWVCRIHWSYAQIIFPAGFAGQKALCKDPTVWLDEARPPSISLMEEHV